MKQRSLRIAYALCLLSVAYGALSIAGLADGGLFAIRSALLIAACMHGRRLERSVAPDTRDEVNVCQVLGICALGMVFIDGIANMVLAHPDWLECAVGAVGVGAYLVAVPAYERSVSWSDETMEWQCVPLPGLVTALSSLAVDADSGFFRPLYPREVGTLHIRSKAEFVERLPSNMAEQIARSIAHPAHCSCSALGKTAFGNVSVPVVALQAAGFEPQGDIAFSYYLDGTSMTLVLEQSAARSLIAACLGDQYLRKSDSVIILLEVFSMLIAKVPRWMDAQGERLEELEGSLAEDVLELPRDFTEFASDTRRELGYLASFYKQAGEMFEDIVEVPSSSSYATETLQMMSALSNRLLRLSADAQALRDQVAELRMGYQERIDLRQNSVISLLTVVTSVFTPLTLVTGWYGMNFSHMPELEVPHAYSVIIALLVAVVTAEVAFFKYRRWF